MEFVEKSDVRKSFWTLEFKRLSFAIRALSAYFLKMKPRIIQIGNPKGIRISKVRLQQSGLGEEVQPDVKKQNIIRGPITKPRQGWCDAFKKMAEQTDC